MTAIAIYKGLALRRAARASLPDFKLATLDTFF